LLKAVLLLPRPGCVKSNDSRVSLGAVVLL
jgi:hypothetical protein